MEKSIDTQIAALVQLIENRYLSTESNYHPLNFSEKASFFTLDVTSELAFGQAFEYLHADRDVYDYFKISKSLFPVMVLTANIPSLADILHSRWMRGLMPKASDKLGFGAFIR